MEFGAALRKITSILDRLPSDIRDQVMRSLTAGYRPPPLSDATRASRYRDGRRHVDRHGGVTDIVTPECHDDVTKVSSGPLSKPLTARNLVDLELPTATAEKPRNLELDARARANGLNADAKEILDFLNRKTGRAYRPVSVNLKLIEARLKSGATRAQVQAVIAIKSRQWSGDATMVKFLRPATLFNATKFEQYLGELPVGDLT